MKALVLAGKDIRLILTDKKSLLFLFLMPIAFTFFLGFVFMEPKETDGRMPILLLDRDGSAVSARLATVLGASRLARFDSDDAKDDAATARVVIDGRYLAVAIIPAGYGDALLSGGDARVEVMYDKTNPAGHTARNEVLAAVNTLRSVVERVRLTEAVLAAPRAVTDGDIAGYFESREAAAADAGELVTMVPAGIDRRPGSSSVLPGYAQTSPGMLVQFTIFGLLFSATGIVAERRRRTLARLAVLPVNGASVILGKFLGTFTVSLVQVLILVVCGQVFFGVDYFRDLAALVLMVLPLVTFASALGLFIGFAARREEEANLAVFLSMILLSALGGAWFPLEGSGPAFRAISRVFPSTWAMDGFRSLLLRGEGVGAVALPAAVLSFWAVGLLVAVGFVLRGTKAIRA